jgi:hypothetical protein
MNNHALIAALGPDAVDTVHGYRVAVLAEAERRRLCLAAEAVPVDAAVTPRGFAGIGAVAIRLAFIYCRSRPDLAGRTLQWGPEQGWSMSHRLANRPLCYYARSVTEPPQLVPSPPELLDWAVAEPSGGAYPPATGQLDNNADAIERLLKFVDPVHSLPPGEASDRTHVEE